MSKSIQLINGVWSLAAILDRSEDFMFNFYKQFSEPQGQESIKRACDVLDLSPLAAKKLMNRSGILSDEEYGEVLAVFKLLQKWRDEDKLSDPDDTRPPKEI